MLLILAGVFDTSSTGAKFTADVVVTGRKLQPVKLTLGANLLPMSLTQVVHLDLRISPTISKNKQNDPLFSGAWGQMDSKKN